MQRRLPDTEGMIGIGVAIVGIVRRDAGVVTMAPNLGWRDVPLGDRLADALGTSLPIAVANEADLGALAELRRGAAVDAQHVLFISGEVGVGGGLIVDGKQLTGAGGFAGEVGHMPVNPDGRTCRCGSVGCWETEIGEGALLRRAGHPPDAGREEVEAVLREAAAGAPDVLEALDAVGRWLGFGLAGLVNVFNPQVVVLGGLFGRIHPFVEPTLGAELDRLGPPPDAGGRARHPGRPRRRRPVARRRGAGLRAAACRPLSVDTSRRGDGLNTKEETPDRAQFSTRSHKPAMDADGSGA